MQPLDNLGNTLCLSKIIAVALPSPPPAVVRESRFTLMALSCSGSVHVVDTIRSGESRWFPVQHHPGFAGLPSATWVDISHIYSGAGVGATLMTLDSRDVYVGGTGTAPSNAPVRWNPVVKLPRIILADGKRLWPRGVGGYSVLTNAGNDRCELNVGCSGDIDRFYHYDLATGQWSRATDGPPWIPLNYTDILRDPNTQLPTFEYPYDQIFDGGSRFSSFAFSVHHIFSWTYFWVSND